MWFESSLYADEIDYLIWDRHNGWRWWSENGYHDDDEDEDGDDDDPDDGDDDADDIYGYWIFEDVWINPSRLILLFITIWILIR